MDYVILIKKAKASQTSRDHDLNFSEALSFNRVIDYYGHTVSQFVGRSNKTKIIYTTSKLFKKDLDENIKKFSSERAAKQFITKEKSKIYGRISTKEWEIVNFTAYQRIRKKHVKEDKDRRDYLAEERKRLKEKHHEEFRKLSTECKLGTAIIHTGKDLTPEQIRENVDRLIAQSERNKNGCYRNPEPTPVPKYTPPLPVTKLRQVRDRKRYNQHFKSLRVHDKEDSNLVNKNLSTQMSLNTLFTKIFIKEKNSGGYLKVPKDGTSIYLVKSINNATIFSNSNQSRWMISEIKARSYMACYHDWDLIEVGPNGKPIDIQAIIQKKKEAAATAIASSLNLPSNNNEPTDDELKEIENSEVNE